MNKNRDQDQRKLVAVLISLFFPPEIGGGSTGAWNRAIVLEKMGYRVYVLSGFPIFRSNKLAPKYRGSRFYFHERINSFEVLRFRTISLGYEGVVNRLIIFLHFILLCILLLPWVLKTTGRPNLVYSRAPIVFSSFIGIVYAKLTGSFFVYEVPDLWPDALVTVNSVYLPIVMSLGKLLAKISYVLPSIIITTSQQAARYIKEKYRINVPIYGIPVGVDVSKYLCYPKYPTRDELIASGVFPEQLRINFLVLYAGLMSTVQNVEALVMAASKLRNEENIAVVLIGDGPNKNNIVRLKKDLAIENLFILSPQPRDAMSRIISAVDVCSIVLSPDRVFEATLPTKLYEYMACGKPILGVCGGEAEEIICVNDVGIVAHGNESEKIVAAIRKFRNSPDLISTMENNCFHTIKQFSLERISASLAEILSKKE